MKRIVSDVRYRSTSNERREEEYEEEKKMENPKIRKQREGIASFAYRVDSLWERLFSVAEHYLSV